MPHFALVPEKAQVGGIVWMALQGDRTQPRYYLQGLEGDDAPSGSARRRCHQAQQLARHVLDLAFQCCQVHHDKVMGQNLTTRPQQADPFYLSPCLVSFALYLFSWLSLFWLCIVSSSLFLSSSEFCLFSFWTACTLVYVLASLTHRVVVMLTCDLFRPSQLSTNRHTLTPADSCIPPASSGPRSDEGEEAIESVTRPRTVDVKLCMFPSEQITLLRVYEHTCSVRCTHLRYVSPNYSKGYQQHAD